MNEQNVKLPDFLIADLYKNSLVEFENIVRNIEGKMETKTVLSKTLDNIKFLGENSKKVIVAVQQNDAVFLPENELNFLTNILKACGLNLANIAIVNYSNQAFTFKILKEQLNAEKIILFDLEPAAIELPFTVPQFQVQRFDGCSILLVPGLDAMNQQNQSSIELKKKLWTSLKKMFDV